MLQFAIFLCTPLVSISIGVRCFRELNDGEIRFAFDAIPPPPTNPLQPPPTSVYPINPNNPTNPTNFPEPRAKHVLVFTILALYVVAILVISANALISGAPD